MQKHGSANDLLIKADQLSKTYLYYENPRQRLKHYLFGDDADAVRITALSDISFSVGRGEVLGVIGNNGAGKSTLLQLVCGTVTPSSGKIQTKGRIAALLELGAGFNPDFTGRENIYLNAALLGFHQPEIESTLDSIIEFADIAEAIDHPLKTYSTGMAMRLAFSIATSTKPDLLIIDEALSVGDGSFARKSFERIMSLRDKGCAILFCSHSMYQVESIADRVMWLEKGKLRAIGPPRVVTRQYAIENLGIDESKPQGLPSPFLEEAVIEDKLHADVQAPSSSAENSQSNFEGQARLVEIAGYLHCGVDSIALDHDEHNALALRSNLDELILKIRFAWDITLKVPSIAFSIEAIEKGIVITSGGSRFDRGGEAFSTPTQWSDKGVAEKTVHLHFPSIPLLHGSYAINIFLACERALHLYDYRKHALRFKVTQSGLEQGFFTIPRRWREDFT